jgi:sodium-dependent phosphate cotransporter
VAILAALYFFICSLSFLSSASLLIMGKEGGKFFSHSDFFNVKPVGLMIGVLATVIFQSSSTTTSIIVALVGSEVLSVR